MTMVEGPARATKPSAATLHDRPGRPGGGLHDVPQVLGLALRRFVRHRADTLGGAIAFQTLLALAPLLVVAVALLSAWLDEGDARARTLHAVAEVVGSRGRAAVADWIEAAADHAESATVFGAALFVFGASRLVVELDVAFDVIFEEEHAVAKVETTLGLIRRFLVDRVRAVALSFFLGALVAFSIGVDVAVGAIVAAHESLAIVVPAVRVLVAPALLTLAFAALYRWLPPQELRWRDAFSGGFVTALLFDVGVFALHAWFAWVDVGAGYGAAGSLVAVLVWLWYTAQIVLFGAEITAVLTERRLARTERHAPSAATTKEGGSSVPDARRGG